MRSIKDGVADIRNLGEKGLQPMIAHLIDDCESGMFRLISGGTLDGSFSSLFFLNMTTHGLSYLLTPMC